MAQAALTVLQTGHLRGELVVAGDPHVKCQVCVVEAIRLIDTQLKRSGTGKPQIGVCALNPYNGDIGSFGGERLDIIIDLAVKSTRQLGIDVIGSYLGNIIFLKVQSDS